MPRRLLIYSHDSFGLGHLRRCRAIAHHLVDRFSDLSVLILSGSPIIGSFDFKARVDFVRVPGVIKLRNGDYTSLQLHIDPEHTLAIRASIISHTAEVFDPHVCLIDKEPLGLRGEVRDTLAMLKARGTRLVLGLRDIMDEPQSLLEEWDRKQVYPALREFYDRIYVYGPRAMFDPLIELPGFAEFAAKVVFTGYLRRSLARWPGDVELEGGLPERPYILVTGGGGGDGDGLVDAVLGAYEADPELPHDCVILFGPFMSLEDRRRFHDRAEQLPKVHCRTFDAWVERLYAGASAVVAMGGYNVFCEILSFDKPALLVPRTVPRREQWLRAQRASRLGAVTTLDLEAASDPRRMARALRELPSAAPPSAAASPLPLDGLERIAADLEPYLASQRGVERLRAIG
ncbi:MAG: glycosyltransferase family protein [Pseudomonadota bacterium]